MKNNKKFILIIDYNLSRFDDVKEMTSYAYSKYGLKTILVRPNPTIIDKSIAYQVIDLDPRNENFIEDAMIALQDFSTEIKSGFVFSDNAVINGAILLKKLGLDTDSPSLAEAAFSKIKYRKLESQCRPFLDNTNFTIPHSQIIHTQDELIDFLNDHPDGIVLKPACEGNNRGVVVLKKGDNLSGVLDSVKSYIKDGLIAEEFISFEEEYSFDGLAHLNFITKKLSVHGKYPVEYGQMILGNLSTDKVELITRAGLIANLIVGQQSGPFHNEIKISATMKKSVVIEPNRRPAGMKIWSLAEKVFKLNFYHLWLDRMIQQVLPARLPDPSGNAAIRMLGAPFDGVVNIPENIQCNPNILFDRVLAVFNKNSKLSQHIEFFDFQLNIKSKQSVVKIPRDNSDFIGQICVYTNDQTLDLENLLNNFHRCWLNVVAEYIISVISGDAA